jgi:hypothetical protein
MTAQHAPSSIAHDSRSPRAAESSLVCDPPSPPVYPSLSSLRSDHLWTTVEPWFGSTAEDAAGNAFLSCILFAPAMGIFLWYLYWVVPLHFPPVQGASITWRLLWAEGGYAALEAAVKSFPQPGRVILLYPVNLIVYILGSAYYTLMAALLVFPINFPLALIYSSTTRNAPLSSLLSLSPHSRIARFIDYLIFPTLFHILVALVAVFVPFSLPPALFALYAVDINFLLLLIGTSIPHIVLILLSFVATSLSECDKRREAKVGGIDSMEKKQAEEVEELKKQIAVLEEKLTGA